MPADITAVEPAARLGIEPARLRAWLRGQSAAGNPLLRAHEHGDNWRFTPGQAAVLAGAYSGDNVSTTFEPGNFRGVDAPPRTPDGAVSPVREARPTYESDGHRTEVEWLGTTVTTLADLLRPRLRAVTIGINPAPASVQAGHYYQGRAGQTFFRRLDMVGLLPQGAGFEDDRAFEGGIGFTDVVKRPTRSAKEVTSQELDHGRSLLEARLASVGAPLLIFVFKQAATTLIGSFEGHGLLPPTRRLYGARMFVMPGPYERRTLVQQALRELEQHLCAN